MYIANIRALRINMCKVAEMIHISHLIRRPVTYSDWWGMMMPKAKKETAQRSWERVLDALITYEVPYSTHNMDSNSSIPKKGVVIKLSKTDVEDHFEQFKVYGSSHSED